LQLVGSSNIHNKKWRQQTLFLVDGGSTICVCGSQHLDHGGGTTVSLIGGNNFRVIMADNISWYLVGTTTVIIGIVVKLREREGQRVDSGWSFKGHL